MIETIEFQRKWYPKFQTEGNASQFAIPFAKHVCKGYGYDIGCMKKSNFSQCSSCRSII